jgi:Protein of unknown function (DUF1329)
MEPIYRVCGMLAAATALSVTGLASTALAADPGELGKSLTPFGAIKAGNADGSIPAYEGGITKAPAGYTLGQHYVDPYAGDKPLFTITGDNVDKYSDRLTVGTIAKLKAYPSFKVIVYPTHRSFSAPQYVYESAIENAKTAHIDSDGESPRDSVNSIPFPLAADAGPLAGVEAMQNHILRWNGTQLKNHTLTAAVTEAGAYVEQKIDLKIIYPYAVKGAHTTLGAYFYAETVAPARTAGDIVLVHEFTDPLQEPRLAWTYNPGQRRVRRAPEVEYDNPIAAYDSLATTDDFFMFNGALIRFDWKLIGKKEMYVPYNDYALQDPKYQYADLIKPLALNADPIRWELHRVYIVEGTLRPNAKHVYSKRVYAIDEDSWNILLADLYDGHGQLWRTHTNYTINFYDVPILSSDGVEYNDLQARRYAVTTLFNQEPVPTYTGTDLQVADFTPDALRRGGH